MAEPESSSVEQATAAPPPEGPPSPPAASSPPMASAPPAALAATVDATTEPPRFASVPAKAPSAGALRLPENTSPLAAYELLTKSARLADLVALTTKVIGDAARDRSAASLGPKVAAAADEAKLGREDASTPFGNALDVLGNGGTNDAERALAAALWAHAVAESPRARTEDEDRLASDILWLATHTAFDATTLLDRALGEEASDLWAAIAVRVRRVERGTGGATGRGEALVGAAALVESTSPKAQALAKSLAGELKDPILGRILGGARETKAVVTSSAVQFTGEMVPTPRGPVATTLLALSGILFLVHGVRFAARLALAYRRPAEVEITDSAIKVKTKRVLLGRTLGEREHVILRSALVRVVRDVRFPRLAFYSGLLALALGSYIGVRAFADGVRAASPSLLVVGIVIIAVGVGADFALGSLVPGLRGKVRVLFVPRTGQALAIGGVDLAKADAVIKATLG